MFAILEPPRDEQFETKLTEMNDTTHHYSSISEGMLSSNVNSSRSHTPPARDHGAFSVSEVEHKIALNTVFARTKLEGLYNSVSPPQKSYGQDWTSFIPPETPDPYNFFNIYSRKRAFGKL